MKVLAAGIRISHCTPKHVLGLCLLNAAVFPPTDKDGGARLPPWKLPGHIMSNCKSLRQRLELNHVMVATKPGRILRDRVVGSVEVHTPAYLRAQAPTLTEEQASLLQPYLCSMAVREDMRGCGIGRALVEAVVAEAEAAAPPGQLMLLQVEANNTAAVALYEACGFSTISHPWCQLAVMRKRLREPDEGLADGLAGAGAGAGAAPVKPQGLDGDLGSSAAGPDGDTEECGTEDAL